MHARTARRTVEAAPVRRRFVVRGAVQGVGFRPHVYRLAHDLRLGGFVRNDSHGVTIEVEGPPGRVERFAARLVPERPPRSVVHAVASETCEPLREGVFVIDASRGDDSPTAIVLADGATCAACREEVRDPRGRRHRYPFTNCTHCGPRYTIMRGIPYDRPLTTMAPFTMCAACRREYEDPSDRRFHAQPIACPECGPEVRLLGTDGRERGVGEDALAGAVAALREGRIVAVKGLGGFQLLVRADDETAVARLRERKARPEKPLAIMAADLDAVRALCDVPEMGARLLTSPEAPIVLLERRPRAAVAPSVAPGFPRLGVMLPTTPLHALLLEGTGVPVVATSGNRSDEPICIADAEAVARLGDIADLLLVHNRELLRPVDDSVVMLGRPVLPIRRARGYAPLPIRVARPGPVVLALGGHLKCTVALAVDDRVVISPHIGDLDTPGARAVFEATVEDLLRLHGVVPEVVAHDLHPDYATTRWLEDVRRDPGRAPWRRAVAAARRVGVQHHHAHLAAALAEHRRTLPSLGVTWDGTGWGGDGTVWGGEFLAGDAAGFERVASLRPFRLPGAEAAVHDPRRVALALRWALVGSDAFAEPVAAAFSPAEQRVLARMLEGGPNTPWTTSAGRLFDGVAALLGLVGRTSFEGQAAMALEHAVDPLEESGYPLPLRTDTDGRRVLDWEPMLADLAADRARGVPVGVCAARFHQGLADGVAVTAAEAGLHDVVLTGGCFANRVLDARVRTRLRQEGFRVRTHRRVPPGDGGLSLGQVAVARAAVEQVVVEREV